MALGKSLTAETQQRVNQVMQWLLEGRYTFEIVESCKKDWELEQAQAYNYIARAKVQIQALYEKDAETAIQSIMAQMNDLYRANRKIKDYKAAHAVLKSILDYYHPRESKIMLGLAPDIMALLPQLQAAAKEANVPLAELLQSNIEALKAGE